MVPAPGIESDASQETESYPLDLVVWSVFHLMCVLQAPPMPSLIILIISGEKYVL
jgi:hypothetical protein